MRKLLRLLLALFVLGVLPSYVAMELLENSFSGERLLFVRVLFVLVWSAFLNSIVLVYTPGDEGAVVEDLLGGGRFHALGTGLNPKFPWEKLCPDRKVSTKTRTSTGKENFLTQDGIQLSISWAFTWRPDIANLGAFFLVDEKTIEQTIKDKVQAWLVQKCAANTAHDIRTNLDNTDPSKFCLPKQFEADFVKREVSPGVYEDVNHDFEKKFGVEIIQILPNDISYPDAIQAAKNAQKVQEELLKIAKGLYDAANPDITQTAATAQDMQNELLETAKMLFEAAKAAKDTKYTFQRALEDALTLATKSGKLKVAGDSKYTFEKALEDALVLADKTKGIRVSGNSRSGTLLNVGGNGGTP